MLPLMLDLRGRRCLVVGAGTVATRRAEVLVGEGAVVTVVATRASDSVAAMAAAGSVSLHARPFVESDVEGSLFVFAATDDREVNVRVSEAARSRGVLVNVADDPELCDLHVPARVQRGALQIAVASDGEAPFVVKRLRQLLDRRMGAGWVSWMDSAARFRRTVRSKGEGAVEAEASFDAFFAATVDEQRLTVRVPEPEEEEAWLRTERRPDAVRRGSVSLVGAGPGDPGLLTVRGRERVMKADSVVYDRLAIRALPCDLPASVELYAVGKESGNHPIPQEEIEALLVRLAREGKRVVRFKGGDPYVFGRGSEEAAALSAAGIPFEVVPGVTAGVAAPASAGIAVTARGVATGVTFVTAHGGAGGDARVRALVADTDATIVGFMGLTSLPRVVADFLDAGMASDTPAAVVELGTTADQRSVFADLGDLPERAAAASIGPPAVLVIGKAAAHRPSLDWRRERPLTGCRIALFDVAPGVVLELEEAGADVLGLTRPVTPAARLVLAAAPPGAWVVRDVQELALLVEGVSGRGALVCCLSTNAARQAHDAGFTRVLELPGAAPAAIITALRGAGNWGAGNRTRVL
jgi:uroporphyrin-III C-methyltransferase/precorrin-2 dehydrogenase/sirohydrochlorin ferrochelatase